MGALLHLRAGMVGGPCRDLSHWRVTSADRMDNEYKLIGGPIRAPSGLQRVQVIKRSL
jgi:hypothetical protein